MKYFFVIFIIFFTMACSPREQVRGNLVKPTAIERLLANNANKQQVVESLGTPTTVTSFGNNIWYYMGQRREEVAFFTPEVQQHLVYRLIFDDENRLIEITQYNEQDIQNIAFSNEETETVGTETTVVQQLLGNVGRFRQQQPAQ